MAKNNESLNNSLFQLLRSRGYNPTLLGTDGKEIPVPDEAEVFQFHFIKDDKDYGPVTISIDGLNKLVIYYNDAIAGSPSEEGHSEDTSWFTLLNHLKRFSQGHQLSFELKNTDHLKYDMAKRNNMKKIDETKGKSPYGPGGLVRDPPEKEIGVKIGKGGMKQFKVKTPPKKDKVEEQAKWRQGYSASGHPPGTMVEGSGPKEKQKRPFQSLDQMRDTAKQKSEKNKQDKKATAAEKIGKKQVEEGQLNEFSPEDMQAATWYADPANKKAYQSYRYKKDQEENRRGTQAWSTNYMQKNNMNAAVKAYKDAVMGIEHGRAMDLPSGAPKGGARAPGQGTNLSDAMGKQIADMVQKAQAGQVTFAQATAFINGQTQKITGKPVTKPAATPAPNPNGTTPVAEGYYATGRKSSYSDAVPQVKIILQHSRQLEEGERRYRAIERIFVENAAGERFLLDTKKPGLARVYARHIAEGGTPYDEQGKHIHSLCEEYTQMAGFVRATRNGQFNESTQSLVNEGVNHYNNLRETLHKMAGRRGYNAYFESWTPTLTEDEDSTDLSEMFASTELDPRIESVMPILRKLNKNITEVDHSSELSEWADAIVDESLGLAEVSNELLGRYKKKAGKEASGLDTFANAVAKKGEDPAYKRAADWATKRANKRFSGIVKATNKEFANDQKPVEEGAGPEFVIHKKSRTPGGISGRGGQNVHGVDIKNVYTDKAEAEAHAKHLSKYNPVGYEVSPVNNPKKVAEGDGLESNNPEGIPETTNAGTSRSSGRFYKGWEIIYKNNAPVTGKFVGKHLGKTMCAGSKEALRKMIDLNTNKKVEENGANQLDELKKKTLKSYVKGALNNPWAPEDNVKFPDSDKHVERDKGKQRHKGVNGAIDRLTGQKVKENLGAEQKKVGQAGPTDKAPLRGKLVGACESVEEVDEDLSRRGFLRGAGAVALAGAAGAAMAGTKGPKDWEQGDKFDVSKSGAVKKLQDCIQIVFDVFGPANGVKNANIRADGQFGPDTYKALGLAYRMVSNKNVSDDPLSTKYLKLLDQYGSAADASLGWRAWSSKEAASESVKEGDEGLDAIKRLLGK